MVFFSTTNAFKLMLNITLGCLIIICQGFYMAFPGIAMNFL